jgi:ClpP class serine protease
MSCRDRHLGIWLYEPDVFATEFRLFRDGLLARDVTIDEQRPKPSSQGGGIAVVQVSGKLVKGGSSMGGTDISRNGLYGLVNELAVTGNVSAVVFEIDSPGGTYAGMSELIEAVISLSKVKPTFAHISDAGFSAGYWLAAAVGKERVSINKAGQTGSIGAFVVIEDTSQKVENEGVVIHVIRSAGADMKAQGIDGTPVTEELIAKLQERINEVGAVFIGSVARLRGIPTDTVRRMKADTFNAAEALENGLVDHVRSLEDTIKAAQREVSERRKVQGDMAARARRLEIEKRT